MRPPVLLVIGMLGLIGCHQLSRIDLSQREDALVFLVAVNQAGSPLRISGPVGLQDGRVAFGERPQIELRAQEAEVVLVAISMASLSQRFPGFVRDRAGELNVLIEAPPAQPVQAVDEQLNTSVLAALPQASFERLALDAEASAEPLSSAELERLQARLSITVPVDPEFCRPQQISALVPFGRDRAVTEGLENIAEGGNRMQDLAATEDGELLFLISPGALYAVRRGRNVQPQGVLPGGAFFSAGPGSLGRFALDPRPGAQRRLIVLGEHEDRSTDPPVFRTEAFDVRFENDALTLVGTATAAVGHRFRDVDVDAQGRAMIVGDGGWVWILDPEGPTRSFKVPDIAPDNTARRVVWLKEQGPAEPFDALITTKSQVHLWEESGRFESARFVQPTGSNVTFYAVEEGEGALWAGGTGGVLVEYKPSRGWTRVDVMPPPSFLKCGGPEFLQQRQQVLNIRGLAFDRDHLHVTLDDCTSVMHLRTSDQCASLTAPLGEEANVTSNGYLDSIFGGRLFVIGRNGVVLTTNTP